MKFYMVATLAAALTLSACSSTQTRTTSSEELKIDSPLLGLVTQQGGFFPPSPPGVEPVCNYRELRVYQSGEIVKSQCDKQQVLVSKLSPDELDKLLKQAATLPDKLGEMGNSKNAPSMGCMHSPATFFSIFRGETQIDVGAEYCGQLVPEKATPESKMLNDWLHDLYYAK